MLSVGGCVVNTSVISYNHYSVQGVLSENRYGVWPANGMAYTINAYQVFSEQNRCNVTQFSNIMHKLLSDDGITMYLDGCT